MFLYTELIARYWWHIKPVYDVANLLILFINIILQLSAAMFEYTKPLLDGSIHIYHWSSFSGAIV